MTDRSDENAPKHRKARERRWRRRARNPYLGGYALVARLPDGRLWSQPIPDSVVRALSGVRHV